MTGALCAVSVVARSASAADGGAVLLALLAVLGLLAVLFYERPNHEGYAGAAVPAAAAPATD